jgi:hypothetical protein
VLERRWGVVTSVLEHGQRLLDPSFRGGLAREMATSGTASKPFFYRTLRLFWQGGGGKASLACNYHSCGHPGRERIPAEGSKKTGRPRSIQPGVGLVATCKHRLHMTLALERKKLDGNVGRLREAYHWMLFSFYPDDIQVTPRIKGLDFLDRGKVQDAKGGAQPAGGMHAKVEILNHDSVPTFEQFHYRFEQHLDYAATTSASSCCCPAH